MHGQLPPLPLVRYAVRVTTTARPDHPPTTYEPEYWHVRALELTEAIDHPYTLDIHLITHDTELDIDALVGGQITLSASRDHEERLVHGVIHGAWYLGTYGERLHVRIEAGPALARLGLGRRSRVFQAQTAVEIVQEIVASALHPRGCRIDGSRLRRTYDELDYCVQYRESDLAFVERILAREGIGYLFEQGEDAETMVLFDHPDALRGACLLPDESDERPPPVVVVSTSEADHVGSETIVRLEWRHRARPARVVCSGWDWKRWEPARLDGHAPPPGSPPEPQPPPPGCDTWVEHGGRRLVELHGHGPHLDHGPRTAADLHAHQVAGSQTALGQGNVLAFGPGQTFELEGHPHPALDRTYTLLRVVHRADCPEADVDEPGLFAGPNYENRFECTPAELPWHPRPLPRPEVSGHLLATVVGPPGEEIHTDEHGRIKAWLHWDREHGPEDASASCWLRVAQPWAGAGWGSMFIPRVGMEVLVSFVDGDPDRPLCVGCMYNGHNQTPYPLPEQRTRSTIKTRSTPHGHGFNELRFEDAAGQEEIYLHAERNLVEQVGHDHRRRVGRRETIEVKEDRRIAVGGSATQQVVGTHHLAVQGRTPDGQPGPSPHHAIEVDGDSALTASKSIHLRAQESITLEVGSTTLTLTPEGIVLRGPSASLSLDTGATLEGTSVLVRGAAVTCEGGRTTLRGQQLAVQSGTSITLAAPRVEVDGTFDPGTGP